MDLDAMTRNVPRLDEDAAFEWLGTRGWYRLPSLLGPRQCRDLVDLYGSAEGFRATISMERHGFGRGEYRYFSYPLPAIIAAIREQFYPPLARIANRWAAVRGDQPSYPATHEAFLASCREAGQARPTPLLLRYRPGDFNCLHQDLYGEVHFPFQMAILLSSPASDFAGGEFVMTEQRPRMQSRAHVVPLEQGDAVIFAVNEALRGGRRGAYRVKMRHGVSEIRSGERFAMGVIFHDAR